MAEAAFHLDMERVCFISTSDSYDEISLTGDTDVFDYSRQRGIKNYKISSYMLDYPLIDVTKIKSDSAFNNSLIIMSVLRDKIKNEAFYVIAANSALALQVAGILIILWIADLQQKNPYYQAEHTIN